MLLVAILGIFGHALLSWYNNRKALEIERRRAESNVIIEAIKTGPAGACTNLSFFVRLGFVNDDNQNIKNTCKDFPIGGPPSLR